MKVQIETSKSAKVVGWIVLIACIIIAFGFTMTKY
jgi:hypothetical protein